MDILTSSAVSAVNWLATWRSPSREGSAGVPLAKASLQYVTRFYNYWQNSSSRNQTEESYSLDEICYLIALPDDVNLNILSYLDARSLCHLSQTCSHMYRITGDQLVWRCRLHCDMLSWATLDHLTHPKVYEEIGSDLSYKQIYAKCSSSHTPVKLDRPFSNGVTKVLKSLTRRLRPRIPRVVMFGSGLESIPLVRNMLWEESSPYRPVRLFPGKEGIGSGVCIRHGDYQDINLITLYTSTRAERQSAANGHAPTVNKLLTAYHSNNHDDKELTPAVQELCATTDAYIVVIDSSRALVEGLESDGAMLSTMLHCASHDTPLLVWACTYAKEAEAMPAVEIANMLQLIHLTHPWKVQSMDIETFHGIDDSMEWLVKCCE